jgi:2-polyprenyl-3-methyl-5-hydroxy-6-metoxy-1,4-benzoquinol methylase
MEHRTAGGLVGKLWKYLTHLCGRFSRKYYWEDFDRVYPGGVRLDHRGRQLPTAEHDIRNFLNHQKFYRFAAQFARDRTVADIGCGSGYGSALLKNAGAVLVYGTDASEHAIDYAREHYGDVVEFSVQSITDMGLYEDDQFDQIVCSEVLEHVKEYGKEGLALREIRRITRPGGVVVLSTPNSEMLADHGFSYEEIVALMKEHFAEYGIFENALVPFGSSKELWERRLSDGRTGIVVTQAINLDETVLLHEGVPQLKSGIPAGLYRVGGVEVDTTLLHNTHSWAIVAIESRHVV